MNEGRSRIAHQASPQATPDVVRRYEAAADAIRQTVATIPPGDHATRQASRMRAVVDAAWEYLAPTGISWVGFYLPAFTGPANESDGVGGEFELVLGPSRNKPACSPIGLHGVCGQAFLGETIRIVRDVSELGPNYVACDPRDRSELVLPVDDPEAPPTPRCVAVLDLDSHAIGRFTAADAAGMTALLQAAGFAVRSPPTTG